MTLLEKISYNFNMQKYLVLKNTQKTQNTFCLRVDRPNAPIKSGQCFNVGIPGMDINREYSMYSSSDAPFLEFLIRAVDDGMVSSNLQKLNVGEEVEVDGPYGEFCIPLDKLGSKFFFIGSGTGIAPFHSFVQTYPGLDYTLIHGIRYPNEAYDFEDYRSGKYIPCISRNEGGKGARVTDYLRDNPIPQNSIVYLCGNRNMIIDSVQILLDQGIGGDQIISEVFF
jgi:ferredoxin-NADP reductase